MYSKFVIFYTANYCQKIKSYFDVDLLIQAGIKVEFWDLSEITAHEKLAPVSSAGLTEHKFYSFDEFDNAVRRSTKETVLYLSFVNYAFFSYRVYLILSKYHTDILYASSGVIPILNESNNTSIIKKLTIKRIHAGIRNILISLLKKTSLIRPARYVLISCSKVSCDYKTSSNTKYIECSSGDFNNYQNIANVSPIVGKSIVFIDQYLPFHNDADLLGFQNHLNVDLYYSRLNNFFDIIEKQYDSNVIICAHPAALQYKTTNYFNGRKIVYNNTALQIKNSYGVIAHFSTAISFPVMSNKPIILITSDEIEHNFQYISSYTKLFKNILNLPLVNIDHIEDVSFEPIDELAYSTYKYNYLTTKNGEIKSNGEILISIAKTNEYE